MADQTFGPARDQLLDEPRFSVGTLVFLVIATLALVSDGYDLAAMGYVAPELVKTWGLTPAAFVPAFSAAIVGMMIGGPLLGMLGDRFGRKRLILVGLALIGLVTLATTAVRSTGDLVVLRFLTGLGLGGVIPNVGALVAEMTAPRHRGRVLVIVTMGVPLGIALPGLVAATLVPVWGWRALLVVGGLLPLLVALAGLFLLPESSKFLALRHQPRAAVASGAQGGFRALFAGDLAVVTPLLWFCQAANQMANFFALTWLPTLLAGAAAGGHGSAIASLFSLGGLVSGVVLLLVLDRLGTAPVLLLFAAGVPLVAGMAAAELSPTAHALVIAGAGLCVTGVQIGITALLGIVYPTPVRSAGTGWTQAAGRVGALAAPIVGGVLLALDVPMHRLPLAPALLMALGALACAFLVWRFYRRFGSLRAGEFTRAAPSQAALRQAEFLAS